MRAPEHVKTDSDGLGNIVDFYQQMAPAPPPAQRHFDAATATTAAEEVGEGEGEGEGGGVRSEEEEETEGTAQRAFVEMDRQLLETLFPGGRPPVAYEPAAIDAADDTAVEDADPSHFTGTPLDEDDDDDAPTYVHDNVADDDHDDDASVDASSPQHPSQQQQQHDDYDEPEDVRQTPVFPTLESRQHPYPPPYPPPRPEGDDGGTAIVVREYVEEMDVTDDGESGDDGDRDYTVTADHYYRDYHVHETAELPSPAEPMEASEPLEEDGPPSPEPSAVTPAVKPKERGGRGKRVTISGAAPRQGLSRALRSIVDRTELISNNHGGFVEVEDEHGQLLRRSIRKRIPPVKKWKNETVKYDRRKSSACHARDLLSEPHRYWRYAFHSRGCARSFTRHPPHLQETLQQEAEGDGPGGEKRGHGGCGTPHGDGLRSLWHGRHR